MAKEEKKEDKKEEKEEKEEVEVPEKFKDLVDEIANLSVLELSELVSVLEDKFGVSAAAPAVAAAPAAANGGDQEEEKSDYDVELKSIGQKKIEVIKAVRDITGKGLKDAKALVDSAADSPQTIKEGVPTEKANEIKEKLEEAGAEVELK
jgi:large subunit ribosomal protein L7/L12